MKYLYDLSTSELESLKKALSPSYNYCSSLVETIGVVRNTAQEQGKLDSTVVMSGIPRKICEILSELDRDAKICKSKIDRMKTLLDSKDTELSYIYKKVEDFREYLKVMTRKENEFFSKILFL